MILGGKHADKKNGQDCRMLNAEIWQTTWTGIKICERKQTTVGFEAWTWQFVFGLSGLVTLLGLENYCLPGKRSSHLDMQNASETAQPLR